MNMITTRLEKSYFVSTQEEQGGKWWGLALRNACNRFQNTHFFFPLCENCLFLPV